MKIYYSFIFLLFISIHNILFAQEKEYPKDYFRSPVDFPIILAGNFAELRSNHFHGGLDIKTQGVEGQKLYAIADGFVSRIKVSPWGYGKAIYIDHPNGYTSVYAHMQRFSDEINAYVKSKQMGEKNFAVDLILSKDELKVNKSDIIGLSGNTGGSSGAHLHFEIRDTKTEAALNPMLFGFTVPDNISPILQSVGFYPVKEGIVLGKREIFYTNLVKSANGFFQAPIDQITAIGKVGVGIKVSDMANMAQNKLGAYKIALSVNGEKIYAYQLDAVPFEETRYINSHIDYCLKQINGSQLEKCFLDPGNKLSIYNHIVNNGVIDIEDGKTYDLEFEVADFNGNKSVAKLKIVGKKIEKDIPETSSNKIIGRVDYKKPFEFKSEKISFSFEENSFYDDFNFEFWITDTLPRAIAPSYYIHKALVPVHKNYDLSFDISHIDSSLHKKVFAVRYDNKGKVNVEKHELKDARIHIRPKALGSFTLKTDNLAPAIVPTNFHNKKSMIGAKSIRFTATDYGSGIKNYNAYLNGNWVLLEYEPKQNLFFYDIDENMVKGENTLEIIIEDLVGNTAQQKFLLFY
jgi:hypothetical protein